MTTEPMVLRTQEAAAHIGMNEKDCRALMHAGEIEYYTTAGGHFRIQRWALEDYVRRQVEKTSATGA